MPIIATPATADTDVACPKCEWCGIVREAVLLLNDVARCPLCLTPVMRPDHAG